MSKKLLVLALSPFIACVVLLGVWNYVNKSNSSSLKGTFIEHLYDSQFGNCGIVTKINNDKYLVLGNNAAYLRMQDYVFLYRLINNRAAVMCVSKTEESTTAYYLADGSLISDYPGNTLNNK